MIICELFIVEELILLGLVTNLVLNVVSTFRYLLKQAKWSVSGDIKEDKRDDQLDDLDDDSGKVKTFNKPDLQDSRVEKREEKPKDDVDTALQNALANLQNENEFDLSKRTHILLVSEKRKHTEPFKNIK